MFSTTVAQDKPGLSQIHRLGKQLSTSAGDVVDIKDLIVSAATGPSVRNGEAQTAAAAVVYSASIGACKRETKKKTGAGDN